VSDRKNLIKKIATKTATPPVRKGQGTMAKLIGKSKGGAAHVQSGRHSDADPGVLTIQKAVAYCARQIDPSKDAAVRDAVDLSDRIKSVYGAHYNGLGSAIGSLCVPASAGFLPTHTPHGHEIHGAAEVKKEIEQRIATVKGIDPDEMSAYAAKGGDLGNLATKALNTLSDLAGGATVAPPTLGDMIDLQRNLEVFTRAGANNVTLPPNGRMQFPKLTGGSTAYWVGETAAVTASQQTTGTLSLEVKKLAVRTPLTLELMRFSDQAIEGMVRVDMARQAGLLSDLAQLQGTGGTQIKGLITYPTASSWTQGTDSLLAYSVTGSTFQPEDVAGMVALLPDEIEPTAWVMRRAMWGKIKNRRSDAALPGDAKGPFVFNWGRTVQEGGLSNVESLDSTKVVWSSQVTKTRGSGSQTYILVGYFPDWLVGRLGVLEFMIDPYTNLSTLITNVQCVQFIDAGPRHTASFAFADAVTEQ
jgi:HK97 family phage major capsid protein